MIYAAQDFSDFERCARIPKIRKQWEPERWPVREAAKQHFYAGLFRDPETVADDFLVEAAGRGFEYPDGEPYSLAKDYSSWLDGALRIITEHYSAEPINPIQLGADQFLINGFSSETGINVVRVVHELGDRNLRWPELIALAVGEYSEVVIHQIKLPGIRKRRLPSPLCLSYRQPITGSLRLARLDAEKINFGPAWKRVGRWEVPEVGWKEWRLGIDKDRCLQSIIETYSVPGIKSEERRKVLTDIEHFQVLMSKTIHPRKWEMCESCVFKGVCHDSKRGFIRKSTGRTPYSAASSSIL